MPLETCSCSGSLSSILPCAGQYDAISSLAFAFLELLGNSTLRCQRFLSRRRNTNIHFTAISIATRCQPHRCCLHPTTFLESLRVRCDCHLRITAVLCAIRSSGSINLFDSFSAGRESIHINFDISLSDSLSCTRIDRRPLLTSFTIT